MEDNSIPPVDQPIGEMIADSKQDEMEASAEAARARMLGTPAGPKEKTHLELLEERTEDPDLPAEPTISLDQYTAEAGKREALNAEVDKQDSAPSPGQANKTPGVYDTPAPEIPEDGGRGRVIMTMKDVAAQLTAGAATDYINTAGGFFRMLGEFQGYMGKGDGPVTMWDHAFNDPSTKLVEPYPEARTAVGAMARFFVDVAPLSITTSAAVIPAIPALRFIGAGIKFADPKKVGKLTKVMNSPHTRSMISDAVADIFISSRWDTLSTILRDEFEWDNAVIDTLATNPDDPRVKQMLVAGAEGVALGGAFRGGVAGLRLLFGLVGMARASFRARTMAKVDPEGAAAASGAAREFAEDAGANPAEAFSGETYSDASPPGDAFESWDPTSGATTGGARTSDPAVGVGGETPDPFPNNPALSKVVMTPEANAGPGQDLANLVVKATVDNAETTKGIRMSAEKLMAGRGSVRLMLRQYSRDWWRAVGTAMEEGGMTSAEAAARKSMMRTVYDNQALRWGHQVGLPPEYYYRYRFGDEPGMAIRSVTNETFNFNPSQMMQRAVDRSRLYGGQPVELWDNIDRALETFDFSSKRKGNSGADLLLKHLYEKSGIKTKDQAEWIGLPLWLERNPNPTEQEVRNFLKENKVVVSVHTVSKAPGPEGPGTATKWHASNLTTPDYDEYHEIILAMPNLPGAATSSAGRAHFKHVPKDNPVNRKRDPRALHYRDPIDNVILHMRVTVREGEFGQKVYLIEELQSDLVASRKTQGSAARILDDKEGFYEWGLKNNKFTQADIDDPESMLTTMEPRRVRRELDGRGQTGQRTRPYDEWVKEITPTVNEWLVSTGRAADADAALAMHPDARMSAREALEYLSTAGQDMTLRRLRMDYVQETGFRADAVFAKPKAGPDGVVILTQPDAPFAKYQELGLKHALVDAVSKDADQLSWVTSRTQRERYPAAEVSAENARVSNVDAKTGARTITLFEGKTRTFQLTVDKDGVITGGKHPEAEMALYFKHYLIGTPLEDVAANAATPRAKTLSQVLGKDAAEQLMSGGKGVRHEYAEVHSFGPVKAGSEASYDTGMRTIIDKVLRRDLGLTEKQMGRVTIEGKKPTSVDETVVPLSDEAGSAPGVRGGPDAHASIYGDSVDDPYAPAVLASDNDYGIDVFTVELTPDMKVAVRTKGLPLYQKTGDPRDGSEKGSIQFNEDGSVLMQMFKGKADYTTFMHESAHLFLHDLEVMPNVPKVELYEWAGVELGVPFKSWPVEAQEKWARGFEKYLATGEAPAGMGRVWKQQREWMAEVYGNTIGSEIDIDLSTDVQKLMKTILGKETGINFAPRSSFVRQEGEDHVAYVNHDHMKSVHDIDGMVQAFANADTPIRDAMSGRVQTHADIRAEAARYGLTVPEMLDLPKNMTEEQAFIIRRAEVASANRVYELSDIARVSGDVEDMNRFRNAVTVHRALNLHVREQSKFAGRLLESRRMDASAGAAHLKAVNQMIEQSGGMENLRQLAERVSELNSSEAVDRFLKTEALDDPRFSTLMHEVFINNLLSSSVTFAANILGNATTLAIGLAHASGAAVWDGVKTGGKDADFGDVQAMTIGLLRGMGEGWTLAARAFEDSYNHQGAGKFDEGLVKRGKGIVAEAVGVSSETGVGKMINGIGSLWRYPTRGLRSTDVFFNTMAYRMELHRLAYREGIAAFEKSGRTMTKDEVGLVMARGLAEPKASSMAQAKQYALKQTFMQDADGLLGKFLGSASGTPFVRKVLPFARTPVNIFKYGLELTPFAPISKEFRGKLRSPDKGVRAQAEAQLGIATSMFFAVGDMVDRGMMVGTYGKDTKDSQQRSGIPECSVSLGGPGGKFVQVKRVEPLGTAICMMADVWTTVDQMNTVDSDELVAAAALHLVQNLASKNMLEGFANFVAAMKGDRTDAAMGLMSNILAAHVIPGYAAVSQIERAVDPKLRDPTVSPADIDPETGDQVSWIYRVINEGMQHVPGASERLPTRVDIWGRDREQDGRDGIAPGTTFGRVYEAVSPIHVSSPDKDVAEYELAFRQNTYSPELPPKTKNGVRLTTEEYNRFTKLSGQYTKEYFDKGWASVSKRPNDGPDGVKVLYMQAWVKAGRDKAWGVMWKGISPERKVKAREKQGGKEELRTPDVMWGMGPTTAAAIRPQQ